MRFAIWSRSYISLAFLILRKPVATSPKPNSFFIAIDTNANVHGFKQNEMIVKLPRIFPNASQKLSEKSQFEVDYYMLPYNPSSQDRCSF